MKWKNNQRDESYIKHKSSISQSILNLLDGCTPDVVYFLFVSIDTIELILYYVSYKKHFFSVKIWKTWNKFSDIIYCLVYHVLVIGTYTGNSMKIADKNYIKS